MQFTQTKLKGSFIIDLDERADHRGFCSYFCAEECAEHGLKQNVMQCNLSFNYKRARLGNALSNCPSLRD